MQILFFDNKIESAVIILVVLIKISIEKDGRPKTGVGRGHPTYSNVHVSYS
jgi:hypothetical protein